MIGVVGPGRTSLLFVAVLGLLVSCTAHHARPTPAISAGELACGYPIQGSIVSGRDVLATITAPAQARTGTDLSIAVVLHPADRGPIAFAGGLPPKVYIVQNGVVKGTYEGPVAGTGISVVVPSTGWPLPTDVLLKGCPTGQVDTAAPDATRKDLPAGTYQLVATVDFLPAGGVSGPNGEYLISSAAQITVTT